MQSGQRKRKVLNARRGRTNALRFAPWTPWVSEGNRSSVALSDARFRWSAMSEKKHILTGVRPTGPLHRGRYAGALDCLAVGLDPERSSLVIESMVPEHAATKGKSVPVAFYIYPAMQFANILMTRAHLVPVGVDGYAKKPGRVEETPIFLP